MGLLWQISPIKSFDFLKNRKIKPDTLFPEIVPFAQEEKRPFRKNPSDELKENFDTRK